MVNRVAKSRVSADENSLSGFPLPGHLYGDMIAIKAMQLETPNDAELGK
jgi:hypothetical protein